MKKLLYTILIIFLCLTFFMLISCGDDNTTTTEPPVTYSITYELNGGANNADNPSGYNAGDTVTLDFPEKADYMFAGWFTDSELTTEVKEIRDKEENLTLYAKWIPLEDVFELHLYNGTYDIKGLKEAAKTVIIPSSYNGFPVKINSNMHFQSEVMEELVIPSDTLHFSKCNTFHLSKSLKDNNCRREEPVYEIYRWGFI